MEGMTTAHGERVVPQLTLGWRLKMARAMTGLNTRDFAERVGVSHGTITNAEGDKRDVRPITIKMWAIASGVDLGWLLTGVDPTDSPDGGSSVTAGYAKSSRDNGPNLGRHAGTLVPLVTVRQARAA